MTLTMHNDEVTCREHTAIRVLYYTSGQPDTNMSTSTGIDATPTHRELASSKVDFDLILTFALSPLPIHLASQSQLRFF
jgi:hypothetical protein